MKKNLTAILAAAFGREVNPLEGTGIISTATVQKISTNVGQFGECTAVIEVVTPEGKTLTLFLNHQIHCSRQQKSYQIGTKVKFEGTHSHHKGLVNVSKLERNQQWTEFIPKDIDRTLTSLGSDAPYMGFGELKKLGEYSDKPCFYQSVYKTSEGYFIVEKGSFGYLVGKNGQVLSHGGHGMVKSEGKLYLSRGAFNFLDYTPRSLSDDCFTDCEDRTERDSSDSLSDMWEERDGGVYYKSWEKIHKCWEKD